MADANIKPIPDWIKELPAYRESVGVLASYYPGTRHATVEVAGVKWCADSYEDDPALSWHPAEDRILYLRHSQTGYHWRATLTVKESVCYVDVVGTAQTIEDAAMAAMAAEFRTVVIADETWYAGTWGVGIEWKCLRGDKVLSVSEHPAPAGGFEWSAPFDGIELFKSAGMHFETMHGDRLTGFSETLEDAIRALDDAPAALRAACRAYLALCSSNGAKVYS
ncbi:MAG: hypothetical protein PHF20_01350 [Halothiobacillaceae bacterium]|nr:hypothetical protein [Halothiobacillaceae bacterium]